jgi:hypothetical protein
MPSFAAFTWAADLPTYEAIKGNRPIGLRTTGRHSREIPFVAMVGEGGAMTKLGGLCGTFLLVLGCSSADLPSPAALGGGGGNSLPGGALGGDSQPANATGGIAGTGSPTGDSQTPPNTPGSGGAGGTAAVVPDATDGVGGTGSSTPMSALDAQASPSDTTAADVPPVIDTSKPQPDLAPAGDGPSVVPPVCSSAGGTCASNSCCAGTTCVNVPELGGAFCAGICETGGDCVSGCCVALQNGGNACALASYCTTCKKAGQEGCVTDVDCCMGAICIQETSGGQETRTVCKDRCTAGSECASGCCAPLTNSSDHVCSAPNFCATPTPPSGTLGTGTYDVTVSRESQDLYKVQFKMTWIKTQFCYEYVYFDRAILIWNGKFASGNRVVFSGGRTCDVVDVLVGQ